MSVNKFKPHVYVIPEDRANEEIANGFILSHLVVKQRQIQVVRPADGWPNVLKEFQTVYISHLQTHENGHVIMLIDFDEQLDSRLKTFRQAIPENLKSRVFVVGAKVKPERLKQELGKNFEDIGLSLADDCHKNAEIVWGHDHLKHNDPDRKRMAQIVKPILFGP